MISPHFELHPFPRVSDETAFSLAMAAHQIEPLYDYTVRRMIGPVQMRGGRLFWDLIKGKCICRNEGKEWHPTIGHFFLRSDLGFHYIRETHRLRSALTGGRGARMITAGWVGTANAIYAILTALYVGRDRILRRPPTVRFMEAGVPLDYFGERMKGRIFRKRRFGRSAAVLD